MGNPKMRTLQVERSRLSAYFHHKIFLWLLPRESIPCPAVLNPWKQLSLYVIDSTICPLEEHIQGIDTSALEHTQRTVPKSALR